MIIRSNSLRIPLKSQSVHCVITSPPYFGLRDYGVSGQIGLESSLEEYIESMIEVFREVHCVLRDDGTLFLNLGDSYATQSGKGDNIPQTKWRANTYPENAPHRSKLTGGKPVAQNRNGAPCPQTLKPKDLCGIPWRVAFALQADGWYLRSDIIWAKPNPMPESVTDRPTKAHEYVFLLSKSAKYFFDQEAVREPHKSIDEQRFPSRQSKRHFPVLGEKNVSGNTSGWNENGRNIRTVWEIATQPFSEAHFATFPEELVKKCMFAGTSEKGCCPKCGGPWVREVEINQIKIGDSKFGNNRTDADRGQERKDVPQQRTRKETKTLGWKPSCECGENPVPCVVFDPFIGSGTVGVVAQKYNRKWVGCELKMDYCKMGKRRTDNTDCAMI